MWPIRDIGEQDANQNWIDARERYSITDRGPKNREGRAVQVPAEATAADQGRRATVLVDWARGLAGVPYPARR